MFKKLLLLLPVLLLPFVLSACSAAQTGTVQPANIVMASMDGMPAEVKAAPVAVQQAYQYAVANPEMLKDIPCYCGCGNMGHASNYACYVAGEDAQGNILYDPHALGCSICVEITLDVMRLQGQGKGFADIRAYIDSTYSQYGPSNIP